MDELSSRRCYVVLGICCMSLLMVGMDSTIVNVALPSIKVDLHASVSGLQWAVAAYVVTLASVLVLAGSAADRLGRRRVFQAGLVVFSAASLACSLAPGLGWLIGFRMVQAVGGSMLTPVAMSIITNVFPNARERARAIGVWGGVSGLSLGIGPVLVGFLTEAFNWRAIFLVNVPIGVAAIALAAIYIPESKAAHPRRIDPLGQVLLIAVLGLATFTIIDAPEQGWMSARTLASFGAVAMLLAGLIFCERRRFEPLIELRLFRSGPFSGATAIAVLSFAAYSGFIFVLTLYLQEVRGLSPLRAGLILLPTAVITLFASPLSGRMVGTYGPRPSLLIACPLMTAGALSMLGIGSHSSYPHVVISVLLFGCGFTFTNAPITNTAVSGLPRAQAGVAAALASTSRQVGSALGVAVVGSLINPVHGGTVATAIAKYGDAVWLTVAGMGAAMIVVAFASTSRRAILSSRRAAEVLLVDEQVAV